jgi:TM2 domain-containing membrane protein YozV
LPLFIELPRRTVLGNLKGLESVIANNRKKETTVRNPGVAAVLSAIIPGVGQFYNGRFLAGILWLIITPGLWIGTGGLLGWVCHVIAAYTAYTYARDHSGQPWKRSAA